MKPSEIDAAIWKIESPFGESRGFLGPLYTRSIDDSMAVIERRWPDAEVTMEFGDSYGLRFHAASIEHTVDAEPFQGAGETNSIALAIALLAALKAEAPNGH